MENYRLLILSFLAAANIWTFILYGMDKWKAMHGKWRTPERTLLLLAFAFGSGGALLGMLVFHHKTRKAKFLILVPSFLILHAILLFYITA